MLNSLRFKAHKILCINRFALLFTAMLRLIARNMADKVFDSKGTLFQGVDITPKICKMELA